MLSVLLDWWFTEGTMVTWERQLMEFRWNIWLCCERLPKVLQGSVWRAPGTLLVFGASQANGLATVHLAKAAGHTVVGVVGAEHSCHEDMVEYVKGMIPVPATAVAEE